jgi:hypothetical protein
MPALSMASAPELLQAGRRERATEQLGWERETRVGFTDAEMGTLLGYRHAAVHRIWPSPAGFFALDYVLERELAVRLKVREAHAEGRTVLVGPARREARRLVVFRRTGSGIDEDSFDLPGGANLVSASPHGNTFFVSLHGRAKLLHYPGWDEADAWSLRAPGSGLRAPGSGGGLDQQSRLGVRRRQL